MNDNKEFEYYPSSEFEIVYSNNHSKYNPPHYDFDPLNVFGVDGKFLGYSWYYGDSVELKIRLNNTILHSDKEHIELFKLYLQDKLLEISFIDMRGEVDYKFTIPAKLKTSLKLNYNEDTLIKRNEYKCNLVLINPYDNSRINLLKEPLSIFVK